MRAWAVRVAAVALAAGLGLAAGSAVARTPGVMSADELILQFKRPQLQAALLRAHEQPAARAAVQRALQALGQRHGVALHHVRTLAVGSALVAVTPASAQLDALVARLAADTEVAAVEINARMTHHTSGVR